MGVGASSFPLWPKPSVGSLCRPRFTSPPNGKFPPIWWNFHPSPQGRGVCLEPPDSAFHLHPAEDVCSGTSALYPPSLPKAHTQQGVYLVLAVSSMEWPWGHCTLTACLPTPSLLDHVIPLTLSLLPNQPAQEGHPHASQEPWGMERPVYPSLGPSASCHHHGP